ncbi:mechanosensitive ion channel family protein [Limosilactobacillus frumenti]|uniref:mechanosensitive ion channel family protein n=1 Tax=Limosilactobacillus frumenti TaxID=104955 RepID=UPI0015EC8C79|nr:mechanosensitive ion channel family protein [Limosilactobacillus frumenti]MBA2914515.1 mechanosensitive ion channel family protein [Limosilactobacillus frumenti]
MSSAINKQAQQVTRAFTDLSWHHISQQILSKLLLIIVTILLFFILLWIGKLIIDHLYHESNNVKFIKSSNRIATIHALILNVYRYTCYFFLLYAILSEIGVPVGTLIAGAGIFSITLGLGAQGFVSDMVNGFFILLEQQLDVGDLVQIDSIKGTVTAIGLRTTQLTGSDGTLTFIPNRNITTVQNFSRNNMASNVDIRISPETPLEQLVAVIKGSNAHLVANTPELSAAPVIVGPLTVNGQLIFRVTVTTKNGTQGAVVSKFLAAYLKALRQQHIPLAWEQPIKK